MTELIISADSHVIEPLMLWQERVPAKFKDAAPRVVHEETTDRLVCAEMNLNLAVGTAAGVLRSDAEMRSAGRWDEDIPKGAYDPITRLIDMERDGICAEVMYPTVGMWMFGVKDLEMAWAFHRAYNDWLSEFCAASPARLKGIGMLIPDDTERAVAELHHLSELGLAGAMLPLDVGDGPRLTGEDFAPFWATAEEVGLPVHFHLGTPRSGKLVREHPIDQVVEPVAMQRLLGYLIFDGLLDAYPNLQIVSGENDASWVGNYLRRADHVYRRRRDRSYEIRNRRSPSEILGEQVWFTFTSDPCAPAVAEIVPLRLIWGSDYPHVSSTWPNSIQVIDEHFAGRSAALRAASIFGNAASLYGFSPDAFELAGTGDKQPV